MEPQGSLQNSQELSTQSCLEPDISSSYHLILSLQDSPYYYSHTYVLVFLTVSFPMGFTKIIYTRSSSPPFQLHAPPILLDLSILLIVAERVQITKLLLMQFSYSPVTSSPFSPSIFPNTLFSNTLSLCSSLNVRDQVSEEPEQKNHRQNYSVV
jgi:hypothetical protein